MATINPKIDALLPRAETAAQYAEIARLEADYMDFARRHSIAAADIVEVLYHRETGELAGLMCGNDADGLTRFVLNFAL